MSHLNWIELALGGVVALALYFLPTLMALGLKRTSLASILLMNLFLGWTIAGWLLALIWAVIGWGDKRLKAL